MDIRLVSLYNVYSSENVPFPVMGSRRCYTGKVVEKHRRKYVHYGAFCG